MQSKGQVYLVGAGPGNEQLISLRAFDLVLKADAIVYDHLISPGLISMFPKRSETFFVGKSGSEHTLEQDQINRLLLRLARQGKCVVRLKGGDPFIFGRGGEELEALRRARIRCEVIPGITAALAAASSLQIPLTHRKLAHQVTFLTGHRGEEKNINWSALIQNKGTLIFYMAVKQMPFIAKQLMRAGLKAQTPSCLVRFATWPEEKAIFAPLSNMAQRAQEAKIKPPALWMIGDVVRLGRKVKILPLSGKKILVTRAKHQASVLSSQLRALGAEVLECPLISIQGARVWENVDRKIVHLSQYDWVIFTSANGVSYFLKRLKHQNKDVRLFGQARIAAIGSATREALLAEGLRADFMPSSFVAEALADELTRAYPVFRKKILLVRGNLRRAVLQEKLTRAGAQVDEIEVYETKPLSTSRRSIQNALRGGVDYVTLTSSSVAQGFVQAAGKKVLKKKTGRPKIASIGPVTSQTLKSLGWKADLEAKTFTLDGLIETLLQDRRKKT